MRRYTPDSPKAIARVLSLALLADGGLDAFELDVLEKHGLVERLGIPRADFDRAMHEFCEDMLQYAPRSSNGHIELDRASVAQVLSEIHDRDLQYRVLGGIFEIVLSDGILHRAESTLIRQALDAWHIDLTRSPQAHRPNRRWPPQARHSAPASF